MRRFAPVLLALLLLAMPACTSKPEETGQPRVTVFLDNDVTAEQRGAVEQRLRSMPSVEGVTFESREQAYERTKESLKDRPDVLAEVKPESMPESSFYATVTDASIAEAVELATATVTVL